MGRASYHPEHLRGVWQALVAAGLAHSATARAGTSARVTLTAHLRTGGRLLKCATYRLWF